MLQWFHALMPKEERFFDMFAEHSRAVVAGAKALRAMLEGGDAVTKNFQTVMDREQDADNVTREVLIAVRRTFITPFDRGNIRDLITSMDNTIDQMQKTAKAVMLFNIRSFAPQMKEMGDAIVKCAVLLEEAIPLLHSISTEAGRMAIDMVWAEIALAALAALARRRSDWHAVFVGDGEVLADARESVVRLGIDDRVTFTGFIRDKRRLVQIISRRSSTGSTTSPTSCRAS